MGIRTDKYVFAAIDSRITFKDCETGRRTRTEDFEKKIYGLKNYDIGFATAGTTLRGSSGERIGLSLTEKIDAYGNSKSYKDIIDDIVNEYKLAYVQQVSDNSRTFLLIWGYDPEEKEPFLFKCERPNFEPQLIKKNESLFIGAPQYKSNAIRIFNDLRGNWVERIVKKIRKRDKINLKKWAKDTFDAIKNNEAVEYPLTVMICRKGNKTGSIVYDKNSSVFEDDFNVKLKYME